MDMKGYWSCIIYQIYKLSFPICLKAAYIAVFKDKMFKILTENWQVIFREGNQMTLTSRISKGLILIAFPYQRTQKYQKNFPFKSLGEQIWPCHKKQEHRKRGKIRP